MKTSLYIITYNSPDQVKTLLKSFENCDTNFLTQPRKIMLNNSTDLSTTEEYLEICKQYDIEHVKKDNIGICSGRQWVAEHFAESDSEYMIFFEDDMNLRPNDNFICKRGYPGYINNLYKKSVGIMEQYSYDFLKLTYSEFYGDNYNQWAFYNVPQEIRDKHFPGIPETHGDHTKLPKSIPKARYKYDDLYFLEGNYHFCNWPIWFSKKGNQTLFLDTIWQYPHEATLMSWNFQLQMQNKMRCAVLELSPVDHDRFDHYPAEERREVEDK